MEFYSMLKPHNREESQEKGYKETIDKYEDIVNPKTGELETKKTGEENFYEKIQAEKESCELENIIKRYAIDINNEELIKLQKQLVKDVDNIPIVDTSAMPKDLIEAYALVHKLQSTYDQTTAEFKNYFGSFGKFLKSVQDGKIANDLKEVVRLQKGTPKDVEIVKEAAQQPTNYEEILGGNQE